MVGFVSLGAGCLQKTTPDDEQVCLQHVAGEWLLCVVTFCFCFCFVFVFLGGLNMFAL